jgi:hypothetical protein
VTRIFWKVIFEISALTWIACGLNSQTSKGGGLMQPVTFEITLDNCRLSSDRVQQFILDCPVCGKSHWHGYGAGPRCPHCVKPETGHITFILPDPEQCAVLTRADTKGRPRLKQWL